jgi:hypothetical protein
MNKILKVPSVGRYSMVKDRPSGSGMISRTALESNLKAQVFRNGQPLKAKDVIKPWARFWAGIKSDETLFDFGSGKVTEALVVALAKDSIGTTNNKAAPILTQLTRMYSGTGATAEQAYDYGLQTPIAIASGAITPTPAIVASSNNASLQYVGTIAYTGSSAVTEWGLFNTNQSGSQYNTSTDTFTATTITPTTNPSWTTNVWAGYTVIAGTSSGTANQTGASYYGAFVESNSGTALTIAQATDINYWTVNNNGGAGSTPAGNSRFDIWPFMADHKTFAAINVVNGDSIQFTYTLTIQSGG